MKNPNLTSKDFAGVIMEKSELEGKVNVSFVDHNLQKIGEPYCIDIPTDGFLRDVYVEQMIKRRIKNIQNIIDDQSNSSM